MGLFGCNNTSDYELRLGTHTHAVRIQHGIAKSSLCLKVTRLDYQFK